MGGADLYLAAIRSCVVNRVAKNQRYYGPGFPLLEPRSWAGYLTHKNRTSEWTRLVPEAFCAYTRSYSLRDCGSSPRWRLSSANGGLGWLPGDIAGRTEDDQRAVGSRGACDYFVSPSGPERSWPSQYGIQLRAD